uniref:dmX-like protein 1 isoform X3 n=1 Tax=Styela clava TaxID=7725 RepID=UPI001939ACC1|nr:dmX-like protein 1 isoform X3 [Styela clava]
MRRHQVLTGAVNPGNHCFSVGSIASFTFWAYGSGCDLVILGVDLQPIHIIPGHVKGYKLITCLDCCQFVGKIAVSYGRDIVIYHPKLLRNENDDVPVFTWIEETTLTLEESVGRATVLSWASTGERLLVGCNEILLYEIKKESAKEPKSHTLKVQFSIEEIEEEDETEDNVTAEEEAVPQEVKWELAWSSGIEENPHDVQYAPDDTLFASISRGDSMIKVWHQRNALPMHLFKDASSPGKKHTQDGNIQNTMSSTSHMDLHEQYHTSLPTTTKLDFTFTYLVHPKPVAGFSWRKGVPLLPNGSVPNVLISSCRDNMCRIWCETLTPETDVTKLAAAHATTQPKHQVGKKRHHLHHDKGTSGTVPVKKSVSAPMMSHNNEGMVSDFQIPKQPIKRLFRHFHIAATINPTSDIPLLPSISSMENGLDGTSDDDDETSELSVFTVHWLDNKHHHAMAHLNEILHETMLENKTEDSQYKLDVEEDRKSVSSQASISTNPSIRSSRPSSPLKRPSGFTAKFPVWDSTKPESVDAYLSCLASPISPDVQSDLGLCLPSNVYDLLRRAWLEQSDALFAIHPTDGSLLVWHISYLDENRCGQIRQAQVSFSSRIPMAIPARDASTLCSRLVLYANHYSSHLSFNDANTSSGILPQANQDNGNGDQLDQDFIASNGNASPSISLLSKHSDGSLNRWEIVFSANASYSTVSSISHRSRFCGHRYHMSGIFCHPTLPLLLTTSRHTTQLKNTESSNEGSKVKSELILWRVDPVGALCQTGGVTELSRLNGPSEDDFSKVAWFPVLFPSWCLGPANTSPSTCFLSLHGSSLHIYQVVIDAQYLLDGLDVPGDPCGLNKEKIGCIASQQSSAHPGCLILLDILPVPGDIITASGEILLLTVFPEDQFSKSHDLEKETDGSQQTPKRGHGISETFYVVLILKTKTAFGSSNIVARTWKISFTAHLSSVSGSRSHRNTATAVSTDSSDDSSDNDSMTDDASDMFFQKLSFLNVSSKELKSQNLKHTPGENISLATAASDPFSLSVFHRIQELPYSILTTSDNGKVYFWRGMASIFQGLEERENVTWEPWDSNTPENAEKDASNIIQSQISITGMPLVIKMAHCCLLACLSTDDSDGRNLCFVSIFESVSSGGSIWRLQDKILVGKVDFIASRRVHLDWLSRGDGTFLLTVNIGRKVKIYAQSPIGMQWEDVTVSEAVDNDKPTPSIRPLLKRQSTLDAMTRQKLLGSYKAGKRKSFEKNREGQCSPECDHLLHWSLLSEIALGNSAGLSASNLARPMMSDPQPVMVSWVRDGLLLIATETEMHVFCHWMEQSDTIKPPSGVLYGSASLSQSTPEGLCQYLMQEPDSQGFSELSTNAPVVSLMTVADVLSPCLPQYHPLVLSELTNGGHLDTVKHILINLTMMINGQLESKNDVIQVEPIKLKKFRLDVDDSTNDESQKYHLAPVLLHDLLDDDGRINERMAYVSTSEKTKGSVAIPSNTKLSQNNKEAENDYGELFSTSLMDDDDQDGLNLMLDNEPKQESTDLIDLSQFEPGYLGQEHCQVLHNYLSRNLLPGLSSLDQMELMAIADTVANAVHSQVTSEVEGAGGIGVAAGGRGYASSGNTATESMDSCGLRFVFAMHNHLCLLRSLPAPQRAKLLRQGLGSCHFAWAFHSDAEEEILSLISSVQRGAPEWEELRSFGAGWWIRSTPTLRRLIEQTARAAFQKDSNPLDAAIFYMALNKKNIIKGLFKSTHDDRMTHFFSQDFSEERWHRAALKNAFALMGKQRFQEAAAFFLLANSVQDAVEVCIEKMGDLQLASIIVRLYDQEKSSSAYSEFLQNYVLGGKQEEAATKNKKILPDPFIRSMANWQLGSYDESLKTLLDNRRRCSDETDLSHVNITDIFNFYNFLRTHPLIMRQKKIDQSQAVSSADQQVDDSITHEERMLFFATAATHLDAGCPLLTLDVLSSLPPLIQEENGHSEDKGTNSQQDVASDLFDTRPVAKANTFASSNDWNVPTIMETSYDAGIKDELELDWSEEEEDNESLSEEDRPKVNIIAPTPIKKEIEEKKMETPKSEPKKSKALYSDMYAHQLRLMACLKIFVSELKSLAMTYHSDGGQIRDQLSSWLEKETEVLHRLSPHSHIKSPTAKLADVQQGHDTDRSQKSDFSSGSESEEEHKMSYSRKTEGDSPAGGTLMPAPSLHELYLAEKQDWKIRREMACHRRRWLRQYRRFLRTLLSYCGLHDDAQGSLSPLRMELLLLLQESLQERTPQQLSSPVPNPTSIPLLSSSVVACRTVVAEPTARLSHMAQDILANLLNFTYPPPYNTWTATQSATVVLCRQAESLSSCIYQSLCDTNSKTYRARLLDNDRTHIPDTLHLPGSVGSGFEQKYVPPGTQPSQWPGVVSLKALLSSESDSRPKLIVLLCESLVAVYISLLVHGLQTCNSLLLYRLVSNSISEKTWNAVFGGGARVIVKYTKPISGQIVRRSHSREHIGSPNRAIDGSKVRDKLNRKVLSYSLERKGSFSESFHSNDATSYREKFVAPETTLWDWFLSKPLITFSGAEDISFESDSDNDDDDNDSISITDDEDEFGELKTEVKVTEHGNPNSYSWHILRLTVVRSVLQNLKSFLPTTGLELSELGISSPMLNSVMQLLGHWQISLAKELESFTNPPDDYMKGIQDVGTSLRGRPAILKHQAMLDPNNTPFSGSSIDALGARRLWHCLVRKENLQDLFIRYIFKKKVPVETKKHPKHLERRDTVNTNLGSPIHTNQQKADLPSPASTKKLGARRATIAVMSPGADNSNQQFRFGDQKHKLGSTDRGVGKVKILHKETEIISSFCINNANPNCVVLATNRDVQELDISTLLASDTWSWVEEDISTSLEDVQKPISHKEEDFLMVSRKQSMFVSPTTSQQLLPAPPSSIPWNGSTQTGQGASVLLKRSFSGVRRMSSHPTLPYYLTGHHDGSIRMWEWGHQQQISLFRATGQFPKVTNLHFSSLGNKIAAVDADGYLASWQVSSPKKPFLYHQCHDRNATDCCFMSSTSVLATTGLSHNNRNVAIWDTLLPPRAMLVKDFLVHEGVGATCVNYSAQHRTLVVGARDGKISVFDLRRPDDPLHCFAAHEAHIKCIGLSPDEKLFVTGSVSGDVRVWDINSHLLTYNLSGEHARTSIFRNFGSGTMKVQIAQPGNRVFSCGADGTLKLRILPHDPQEDFALGNSIGSRIQKLTLQRQVVKLANAIRQQCLAY